MLTGSLVLVADLIRQLDLPLRVGVIQARSYRGAATRPGPLEINDSMLPDIRGRDVLLVDDIFDTGHTLAALVEQMRALEPRSRALGRAAAQAGPAGSRASRPTTWRSRFPTCSSSATAWTIKTPIVTCPSWRCSKPDDLAAGARHDAAHPAHHSHARSLGRREATDAAWPRGCRATSSTCTSARSRTADRWRPIWSRRAFPLTVIGKQWKFDPAAWWRLRRHIARLKPDLVQTWLFAANAYGRTAAISAGVPTDRGQRAVRRLVEGVAPVGDRSLPGQAHRRDRRQQPRRRASSTSSTACRPTSCG